MTGSHQETDTDKQRSAHQTAKQTNRWLIVLHLFGGGMLFNALQASRELPDLGAMPALILIVIGYFGSMVLVSALWKKVTIKSHRIWAGISLGPAYAVLAVLLAWSIDEILK